MAWPRPTSARRKLLCAKARFSPQRAASWPDVTEFSCEVAVLGGGLAGCSAALGLARSGVDVALFEAGMLPRHRVCGEFLSPESRATLKRLEILSAIEEVGARAVRTSRFHCGKQSADFDLGKASGLAISRLALDPLLVGACRKAGARAFLCAKTRDLKRQKSDFSFEVNGSHWRAKSVILAAGRARSPKSDKRREKRFCGLKAHFSGVELPVGEVEMQLFRGGYCGLVRVEGAATNVCLLVDYARLRGLSPEAFWQKLQIEIPALKAKFERAGRICEWQSTGNVQFGRFRPCGEESESQISNDIARGTLCAGDAAGYIHPLTGDGMAMALRAGELAATVARLGIRGLESDEAARLYRAAWHREFGPRLALAARIHPLALHPHFALPILPILRHFPALSSALMRGTRGAL